MNVCVKQAKKNPSFDGLPAARVVNLMELF